MEESFHVRNILGRGTTIGSTLYYPKATGKTGTGPGAWDYNRTTVASTTVKPAFAMNFERVTAPVEWIAGILTLPIEMLEDLSWLTSYLATYAPIELLKEEDDQIFNGDGTGNTLNGLINKITQGDFLVGDFLRGAALVTRSAMQLRFFDQNKDNVEKNMMTVRIEERVALPKFYEDAFITGTLTPAS